MLQIILILTLAYLLGSIPFSLIIARLFKGIDIRNHGSGNIGATNVLRTVGKKEAALALIADVLKGVLPVLFTVFVLEEVWIAATAVFVVLGHVFPIFAGLKGGKGVATSLGALIVIIPAGVIVSLIVWFLVLIVFRYASLASISAAIALPAICWGLTTPLAFTAAASINAVIIILKHTGNIKRLITGTENKVF
ncbi:MAG: glycerol-3-phosphate 1-O-acyltransferase PlsY [Nitrospinota bacterium]|mgnify:CR=1 FL=1|jgi:glycerol-3-phosphate acyltransferase PlsY|nr:acyl-phosphate glycerol 3-phosphate acyltransferase [Nitrospinota bacterium]MDP7350502.1 glycerol-3-phosphate 1-O-acyltransferase PlsY [Nitrospinota bacterium]MDP7555379.1 glycerol-3-phosphate 1-O-acyltransferase PlsY [Nitrospinota bacterium]MDP7581541.1 glycerol-3-phosphate 1-O-acyltransferase PlsY [Nitrospinota bacterium]HJN02867.1 glycerol-3-phosphate 1-O-acyltransferase PlsY [Nitrospinota bacterium]